MDIVELWRIYWPDWTPATIIAGFIGITVLMFPMLVRVKNKALSVGRFAAMLILLIWLYWVYASCVFCRSSYADYHYILKPLWSYELILKNHNRFMLHEILLNCIMLIPVGVLFPIAFDCKSLLDTTVFGFLCSFGIEVMQLCFKRGLFEWDDMLHNTIGVLAGFLVLKLVQKAYASLAK